MTRFLAVNFMLPIEASYYDGKPTGDYWDKPIKEDSPTAEHNANVEKKMKVVEQVWELRKQRFNKGGVAGLVGISRATVTKYLKEDFNPSSPYYNTTIRSKIKPMLEIYRICPVKGKHLSRSVWQSAKKGMTGQIPQSVCLPRGSVKP